MGSTESQPSAGSIRMRPFGEDDMEFMQRLYARLGFAVIEDRGVNHYMEWRPDCDGEAAS